MRELFSLQVFTSLDDSFQTSFQLRLYQFQTIVCMIKLGLVAANSIPVYNNVMRHESKKTCFCKANNLTFTIYNKHPTQWNVINQ